jgi:tRNA A37 methylthiotransferase MiaB
LIKSELLFQTDLSQDMIAGFPTETEEDHQDTLSLMEYVNITLVICIPT